MSLASSFVYTHKMGVFVNQILVVLLCWSSQRCTTCLYWFWLSNVFIRVWKNSFRGWFMQKETWWTIILLLSKNIGIRKSKMVIHKRRPDFPKHHPGFSCKISTLTSSPFLVQNYNRGLEQLSVANLNGLREMILVRRLNLDAVTWLVQWVVKIHIFPFS